MYDVIIIGGGPAGLTAGIYAGRAGLSCVILERMFCGGQAALTYEIDNYPGFNETVSGIDFAQKLQAHAEKFGAEIVYCDVTGLDLAGKTKKVSTSNGVYEGKTVILALGATPKKLGVPKEDELKGAGVSYCATCDGAFYKDKTAAVVGGGDTALEDALYLSRFCKKVFLIHRRNSFRGTKVLQDKVHQNGKIELLMNKTVNELETEDGALSNIHVEDVVTKEKTPVNVNGVFVAVGVQPESQVLDGIVELDESGYIITNAEMQTNLEGVYAAGDIVKKPLRQIVTAASDGAIAAYSAGKYITEKYVD